MSDRTLYIFINEDGRHSIIARDYAPKECDVLSIIPKEYSGWFVRMDGNYHSKRKKITLDIVNVINSPSVNWEEAKDLFLNIRKAS